MPARATQLTVALVLAIGWASLAQAQPAQPATGKPMKEEKPGLLKQATITPDAARKTALARVPSGRIKAEEIEVEDGKLAYSFDITLPGKRGVEEVLVDAKSGAVISQEHESPAQEAEEAKREGKAPQGHAAATKAPAYR